MNALAANEPHWFRMQQQNMRKLSLIVEQDEESSFEAVVQDKTANMTGIELDLIENLEEEVSERGSVS